MPDRDKQADASPLDALLALVASDAQATAEERAWAERLLQGERAQEGERKPPQKKRRVRSADR
jgi:hypothetical protein